MYRRFVFEGQVHELLDCVPLAVRRKLDLAGLKISLAGWQSLPRHERLALCHLPVDSRDEIAVYREALAGFAARAGADLKPIDVADPAAWSADRVPAEVSAHATEIGAPLDAAAWGELTEEERYCVLKYSDDRRREKLAILLAELGLRAG